MCVWRGGTSVFWAPTPPGEGNLCEEEQSEDGTIVEFTRCGKGDYAICSHKSLGCPVSKMKVQSSSEPRPNGYECSVFLGGDLVLYF